MKARQWITASIWAALVAAAAAGLVWTGRGSQPPAAPVPASGPGPSQGQGPAQGKPGRPRERVVDESPLQVARALAPLAATPEEQTYARQAVRLANHVVDLAFSDALRQAAENPPPPTEEIKRLEAEKDKAEATVASDQKRVAQLTQAAAAAKGDAQEALQDQLEVAKAQLELDQDELEAAAEDLERAGGDPQARIRRLIAAHQAADKESQAAVGTGAPEAAEAFGEGTLVARVRAWGRARGKRTRLEQARQLSADKLERMGKRRNDLMQRVAQEKATREAAKEKAKGFAEAGADDEEVGSKALAKGALAALKKHMDDQRRLTNLGKRIQDHQDLTEVYDSWGLLARSAEQSALHGVLERILWILGILGLVYAATLVIERILGRLAQERRRAATARAVAKAVAQVLGTLAILLVVFGLPSQTTTILGLAGAGLTVALKDFIVAFLGWFVLMGRNGVHVGDWVEIKGVGGEVVEIGLLRTVVLETGNWSEEGHPTGRRVAFMNSFAIEGHFFNFSTSGQWMWDELNVLVPAGEDPYPFIEAVRRRVEDETLPNVKEAEQEWRQATTRYRVHGFSAVPGVSVVPTPAGVELHVRYVTRAYERHETRRKLYEALVGLMHPKEGSGL